MKIDEVVNLILKKLIIWLFKRKQHQMQCIYTRDFNNGSQYYKL